MNKRRKRQNFVIKTFLFLAILLVALLALIFFIPQESEDDLSGINGFYQLNYLEGYNFKYHDSQDGCDYSYKGVSLRDGDRIVNARVLSNVLCKLCGKNETYRLPSENSKVSVDIERSEPAIGDIFFDGTGAELKDIKFIQ